jgi:hypothetical protein
VLNDTFNHLDWKMWNCGCDIGSRRYSGNEFGSFSGRRLSDQLYSLVPNAYPDQSASISLTDITMIIRDAIPVALIVSWKCRQVDVVKRYSLTM